MMRAVRTSLVWRLALVTALLIVAIVGGTVWLWATSEARTVREQKLAEAHTLATGISNVLLNELDDENWAQARVIAELLIGEDRDLLYFALHDRRRENRIVTGVPRDIDAQFIPDLVELDVTRAALAATKPLSQETWLLRPIAIGTEQTRAFAGEPIIEVAAPTRRASGEIIGTLRLGLSLVAIDRAVADVIKTTLTLGAIALIVGLAGAVLLAQRMARPIRRLASDARHIASGDLTHRTQVDRSDEIGQLGHAFNGMTENLERSFNQLKRTLTTFERFVPRKFLTVVAPDGIENIKVGTSARRDIAVLFSDLRGYTKLSSGLSADEVFAMLNAYLERMGRAIDGAGGFVDKYIGDAIMALFDDPHTDAVLDAVLAMRRELAALNAERERLNLPRIENGIGVHVGEVVMGTIGFASKIESTVIGDAVNVASRVEGLTKEQGLDVLVTEAVVARLKDPDRFALKLVAPGVTLRGRSTPIDLYTLEG
jgi:adenylate cyclase